MYKRVNGNIITKPIKPKFKNFNTAVNLFRSFIGMKTNDYNRADYDRMLAIYNKQIVKYDAAIIEAKNFREQSSSDHLALLRCLGGRPLSDSEINKKRFDGYISQSELNFYNMLLEKSETEWEMFHQVEIRDLSNPVDIIVAMPMHQIYVIEFDGPHHNMSSQRESDDRRDEYLINNGFNIIRISYKTYEQSCIQAVEETLLVLRGKVNPANTSRSEVNFGRNFYEENSGCLMIFIEIHL